MKKNINSIARNTSYFTFALIMQKVVSLTYFGILAKYLTLRELGQYYFAISFTTIFAIFIDLGLSTVLVREVAKNQEDGKKVLTDVIYAKIPLAILAVLGAVIFINFGHLEESSALVTKRLVYLSCICVVLDSFTSSFFSYMRGLHNLKFESLAAVLYQLVVISFGLSSLYFGKSIFWIMFALVLASSFNFVYSFLLIKFKWGVKVFSDLRLEAIRKIMKIAIPFAVFGIFQRLYVYLDTVLLKFISGDYYVGLYQLAFKIVFALQFLPSAFTASLYPAFSAYWVSNKEQLVITFERAVRYLLVISVPISVGTICLSREIIMLINKEFMVVVPSLQVVMLALFFIFVNFPIGSLLNACDEQKRNTVNMIITTVVSVGLNLILIPRFNVLGASLTVLISNVLMTGLGVVQVARIIEFRGWKIGVSVIKVFVSAGLMSFVTFYLKGADINIFLNVFISAIFYFIFVVLSGEVRKEDVISVYKSFVR